MKHGDWILRRRFPAAPGNRRRRFAASASALWGCLDPLSMACGALFHNGSGQGFYSLAAPV